MPRDIEVIGYHGTTNDAAKKIIDEGFQHSRETYDWLGDGIYFWQDAPRRAWEWAKNLSRRRHKKAVVVGARIRFRTGKQEGNEQFIDLLDIPWERDLKKEYEQLKEEKEKEGLPIPKQSQGAHRLDREVINRLVESRRLDGIKVPAARAAFQEGEPIYPDSDLHSRSHVQIVVRDQSIILEKWIEQSPKRQRKTRR